MKCELIRGVESNLRPQDITREKTLSCVCYNIREEQRENPEGESSTVFTYDMLKARGGITESELISFYVHTEYSLDDEIALLKKGGGDEYDEYISRSQELKQEAKEAYATLLSR